MPPPVIDSSATDAEAYVALARQMMLTSRRWRARFNERMKAINQTHARYKVLYWINDSGNQVGQRDLAETMGIEEPTLVRLLDALEAQGMVVRRPSPVDGRAKLVSMTEAAGPVLRTGDVQVAALLEDAFQKIGRDEALVCLDVLTRLHGRLGEMARGGKGRPAPSARPQD